MFQDKISLIVNVKTEDWGLKIGVYGEEIMNYLEQYYNNYDEEGRLLSRHGQVEYLTTMRYIEECLEGISTPSILEVGAGTGRYSVT